MKTGRSRAQALALASLLLGVTACGPAASTGAASSAGATSASGSGAAGGGAGRDGCLAGTWAVDMQDLAQQAAARLTKPGQGTAEGSIKVTFGDAMSIVYADTLTLTS